METGDDAPAQARRAPGRDAAARLEGKRIVCLTKYEPLGASSRMRFHLYQPWLEAAGASVEFRPLLPDSYIEDLYSGRPTNRFRVLRCYVRRFFDALRGGADLFWIEKELFPYLPSFAEWPMARGRTPYAVDYDDAIFHNYDRHSRAVVRRVLGNKLSPLLQNAALVTAGNSYLARYVTERGAKRVEVIPTVVDAARYGGRPDPRDTMVRVGWIGTKTNADYLAPVLRAIAAAQDRVPIRLVTVGIDPVPDLSFPQENHVWSEDTEADIVGSFDIGLMPLADTPWEQGKCGYKLIQCMAAGRPVIASAVGANCDIVTGETGRLVSSEEDWLAALLELAGDRALRRRMGAAARERVVSHYSAQAVAPALIAAFADVLGPSPR